MPSIKCRCIFGFCFASDDYFSSSHATLSFGVGKNILVRISERCVWIMHVLWTFDFTCCSVQSYNLSGLISALSGE